MRLERVGCFPGPTEQHCGPQHLPTSQALSPSSGPTGLGCQANHSSCARVGGQTDSRRARQLRYQCLWPRVDLLLGQKGWLISLLYELLSVEPTVSGWNLNTLIHSLINSPSHSIKYPHKHKIMQVFLFVLTIADYQRQTAL